jgi:alpha-L-fucosidase
LPLSAATETGQFTYELTNLAVGRTYEFRAVVKHPLLTTYGQERTFETK